MLAMVAWNFDGVCVELAFVEELSIIVFQTCIGMFSDIG